MAKIMHKAVGILSYTLFLQGGNSLLRSFLLCASYPYIIPTTRRVAVLPMSYIHTAAIYNPPQRKPRALHLYTLTTPSLLLLFSFS